MGEVIPVEYETGIPLTIIVERGTTTPPVGVTGQGAAGHHVVFPGNRQEVRTEGGKGFRASRLHWLTDEDHDRAHEQTNEYIAEQWEFPETDDKLFGGTLLHRIGYIPKTGVSVSKSGPRYIHIDQYKREQLWASGALYVDSDQDIFTFIRHHVLKQDLRSAVRNETDIDEFIFTEVVTRRQELGKQLLELAAKLATQSIATTYTEAYTQGLIRPEMASDPATLLLKAPFLFGTLRRELAAIRELRQQLTQQYEVALPQAA
jgi:hypothetical protein